MNWLYEAEPSEGTAGRRIHAPRGKTLGGSSSINGHIYNRGQRMDFDSWAQKGNRGWGYADILPYFQRTEKRIGKGDDTYRGRDGGLVVTDIDWRHPLCDAFIDGVVKMGIPLNPDYNGASQEGVGLFPARPVQWPPGQCRTCLPAPRQIPAKRWRCGPRRMCSASCSKASAPSASPTSAAGRKSKSAPARKSSCPAGR